MGYSCGSWRSYSCGVILLLGAAPAAFAQTQSQPRPCFRWSGQVAQTQNQGGGVTLWYYGGEAMLSSSQTSNLWTNALVSLDLSAKWPTGTPPITLVQPDDGNYSSPPAVALGALWASADSTILYQYGGQFSDTPAVAPPAEAIWAYTIASGTWSQVTTNGDTVNRAAEGSAAVVPGAGTGGDNVGYYFSGHLDDHTTQGWSNQVPRLYLSSLVAFDLGSHKTQNLTNFATNGQTSNTSTPDNAPVYRADGTLTYVPNLGTNAKGLLVAVGGATSTQYVDNSVLDVYDLGAGGWTKQSTLGDTIGSRVNHCSVRASSTVNGVETHQIFLYGGQHLNQSDRDSAVYVLDLPSWTWTFVGNLSGAPAGRAGHQCVLDGSQLVVIGGLVASNVLCDQPGVYVYDVSASAWRQSYTANTTYTIPAIIPRPTAGVTPALPPPSPPSSSTNVGAIVGGVVGGLVALALLLLLFLLAMRRRRKARAVEAAAAAAAAEKEMRSPSLDASSEFLSIPYDKTRVSGSSYTSPYGWRGSSGVPGGSQDHADDDVEEMTNGMETAMFSTLVPKRTLVVANPGPDEE